MNDSSKAKAGLSAKKRNLLALLLKDKGVGIFPARNAGTILPRNSSHPLALSFGQEGLWFIDQLNPGKANYSIPCTIRLTGQLKVAGLEQALTEIVRRHESLRTTFVVNEDGTPSQNIRPPTTSVKLSVRDLRELPAAKREPEALRLAAGESQTPFDLGRGPLFRVVLLRLSEDEYVLILNFHHIVADGWSIGVFTRELTTLYGAFSEGRPSPLPELPIQYADFVLWQRERLHGEVLQTLLSYWREQLAGELPDLQLSTDRPRPVVQSYRGKHQSLTFSKDLSGALKIFAQREGVTIYLILLAAFKALLHYYTGQVDIISGSAFANRGRSELEEMIGFFVNTLPVRTDLSGNPSFVELVRRVRNVVLGVHAHQELPLVKLVKELKPNRDLSHNPFYRVVFDFLTPDHNPAVYGYGLSSVAMETRRLSGLTVTPLHVEYNVARFDIAVFVWDMPQGLKGAIEYSTDLFDPATIVQMVEHFEMVLRQAVALPDIKLNELVARLKQIDTKQRARRTKAYREVVHQKLSEIKRKSIPTKKLVRQEALAGERKRGK